ncbi:MAG TPA: TolC family protein [Polyangiaceae bacterium]|jgi:outer membrane protein TolC
MRFLGPFVTLLLLAPPVLAQEPPAPATPGLPDVVFEASAPPAIGLAAAIAAAMAHNPSALVAYGEIRRAEALVVEVRSGALPTLTGNLSLTQLDSPRTLGGAVSLPQSAFQASGVLTVPLIVPKPWALWSQAKDQAEVARMSAQDTRRVVAVAVARAYLAVVAQKRVIEAASRARDTDKAHYEYAHRRFVGGVGNRIDEVRANQQLQSDEANVQLQYANLARDREALGVLVGVGGAIDAQEPTLQTPNDRAQAMNEAERRSDVRAGEARVHQAQHTVDDGWTDYSPYLSGSFVPFYQNPATVTFPSTGWQAELLLTVPFYDGGLRYGQHEERRANRDESRALLDGTVRQARSDVRVAFEEVARADATLAASRDAAKLARTALELADLAYRAGAYTNIEVIDAERTARDAETAVAVAEDGARQARVDLLAATGRLP